MIVNPNERPATGIVSNSTGKMPRWKKILLIVLAVHLVFTVLDACSIQGPCADEHIETIETDIPSTPTPEKKKSHWKKVLVLLIVLSIHLTFTVFDAFVFHGPFARDLLRATADTGHVEIDRLEYHIVPERNEIVMTWEEPVIRNRSHWGEAEKHSRTIPLDPLPPEFARCYVDVTVDPDAPAMFPMSFGSDLLAPIPYLGEENVIGTDPDISTGSGHLPPDMVVHLRVRPEDVSALSEQFYVTISKYNGTLMVPYSRAGSGLREMLMTPDGNERPYSDELLWDAESRPHKMPSRFWGMLQRIVLMPIVVIPDYVAIINNMFWGIWILHKLSNVDW